MKKTTNEKSHIYCGGPGTESNHPKIYLEVSQNNETPTCPYCGKTFNKDIH